MSKPELPDKIKRPALAGILLLAAGAAAIGLSKNPESKADSNAKIELKSALQPKASEIGALVLAIAKEGKGKVDIKEDGDFGEPTLTINGTKYVHGALAESVELQVGMHRNKKGKLDPTTTDGVSVTVSKEYPQDVRGHGPTEYVFITKEHGTWKADGQVSLSPLSPENEVYITSDINDVNNASALALKAESLAEQAVNIVSPL